MRRIFFLAVFLAGFFVTSRAHATAEFPSVIQSHFNITCTDGGIATPDCIICHQNDNGGLGTATRPFGAWMKSNGLTPFNDSELDTLLDKAAAPQPGTGLPLDANCDGIADTDQLKSCDWPALETSGTACSDDAGTSLPITVYYGCQASPALPASAAISISFGLVAVIVFARRKNPRPQKTKGA
jgi:hypothetical protein